METHAKNSEQKRNCCTSLQEEVPMNNQSKIQAKFSPPVLLQELPDETLGQLARVTEELLVEVVVHGRDVPESFLFGLAEER